MLSPLIDTDPDVVGTYRLQGRLGAGGMGAVYLGFGPDNRPAAVKVIRPDLAADPDFRARFRREVTVARRVRGSFVAEVRDADVDAEQPWMATEYVDGVSLAQAIARRGRLPEVMLTGLATGLADALVAVHAAGLVHRDLKPSNILLAWDGPKVIDFGVARDLTSHDQTRTGDVIGTVAWMAPEQFLGERAEPSADIFSWAACVTFAATGRHPFPAGTPTASAMRALNEEPDLEGVPTTLAALLRRALDRSPQARPGAVETVSTLLGEKVLGVAEADEAARRRLESDWVAPALTAATASAQPGARVAAGPAPEVAAEPAPRSIAEPAEPAESAASAEPARPSAGSAPAVAPGPETASGPVGEPVAVALATAEPPARSAAVPAGRRPVPAPPLWALIGAVVMLILLAAGAGLGWVLAPGRDGGPEARAAAPGSAIGSGPGRTSAGAAASGASGGPRGTATATLPSPAARPASPAAGSPGPFPAAAPTRPAADAAAPRSAPRSAAPPAQAPPAQRAPAPPAPAPPAPARPAPPVQPAFDPNGGKTGESVYHAAGNAAGYIWFNSGTANPSKGRNSFTVKDVLCGDDWGIYFQFRYTAAGGGAQQGSRRLPGDCGPVEWSGSIAGAQSAPLDLRWRGCKWDVNHRSADTCEAWVTTTLR